MRTFNNIALTGFFSFILVACGGGGGGSGSQSTPTPTTSTPISSLSSSSLVNASSSTSSSSSSSSLSSSSAIVSSTVSSTLTPAANVDAGKDQLAISGNTVTLTATGNGNSVAPFTYQWSQVSGPSVSLATANTATTSFLAPASAVPVKALFKVVATDKNGKAYTDTVAVNIVSASAVKRYEAESSTGVVLSGTQVASTLTGYSGTGYVTGYDGKDTEATTWTIDFATDGYYKIDVGYQVTGYKEFNLTIDSTTVTGKMPFIDNNFHANSAGTFWLSKGTHTFRISGGWSWYNLDYLEFTPMPAPALPQSVDAEPSDPNANTKTKALYAYMTSLYGKQALSGQQDAEELTTIFNTTGKLPAIYAWDLNAYDSLSINALGLPQSDPIKTGTIEDFINKINTNKEIASLIWHWHSPTDAKSTVNPCPTYPAGTADNDKHCWWNSMYTVHTNINLSAAMADPSSTTYKAIVADIDRIAVQLKKLQDAGITVLWRPLHEADGAWFWWGASGADSYKKLWRLMYDRLTNVNQLHNLIWVETIGDPSWYPGDDVVDFVGVDAYPSDKHDPINGPWETMLERFDGHKMVVLSEFGGVPFIDEMQARGVWWGYFASWNDRDTSNPLGPKKMTTQELISIYTSAAVLTSDEVNIPQ